VELFRLSADMAQYFRRLFPPELPLISSFFQIPRTRSPLPPTYPSNYILLDFTLLRIICDVYECRNLSLCDTLADSNPSVLLGPDILRSTLFFVDL
jgi:hypothetical protein